MKKILVIAAIALLGAAGCKDKKTESKDDPSAKGSDQGSASGTGTGTAATAPDKKDDGSGLAGDGKAVETGAPVAKTTAVLEAVNTENAEQAALTEATPAVAANAKSLMQSDVQDGGDLKLQIVDNGDNSEIRQAVAQVMEKLIGLVNGAVKFPRDIPVIMDKCGQPNAFYSPEDGGKIKMCDEWAPFSYDAFGRYKENKEEVQRMTINTVIETFIHELGHCLIDQWKLPATGNQEDAADQLAAFVLIDEADDSSQIIMDAAEFWLILAVTRGELGRNNYADEHSLDQVRFYNFACLVFGSNPDKYVSLVEDYDLPLRRAVRCKDEYQDMRRAWGGLLEKIMIKA